MRDASFLVLLLSLVDSGKSPLQTAADINFCDEARSLGAARTGVCFPCGPVARGGIPRPCSWQDILGPINLTKG